MALGVYAIETQAQYQPRDFLPTQQQYDEVYRDHGTMMFRTRSQDNEIRRLQDALADKKIERERSVKSIIGYFYKTR